MAQTMEGNAGATAKAPPRRKRRRRYNRGAYFYLFPTFFILAVFIYYPIIESFRLSLNRVAPFGGKELFVGVENYTRLLQSPDFWNTVKVSLWFMVGTVPVGIGLAVAIAILLSVPLKRLSGLYRTLIFVPL